VAGVASDPIRRGARPWWSYARFGVRGLLASVLVMGGWLGWLAHRARVQRTAAAAIRWAGGSLLYDRQMNDYEPRWPRWLGHLIGVDPFEHIVLVNLGSDDAMLVHVGRLDRLERLSLDGSMISDSGLMHLEGLTRLRWLNLRDTKVGDAGVDHLRGLTELRRLNLRRTSVSDAGLVRLKGLVNLEDLDIGGTLVTDAGVQELRKALPKLKISR
jgi:Leucine Rich repeat